MEQSIVFITKAYHHYETLHEILEAHALYYPIFYGDGPDACLAIAREQMKQGAKVIISTDFLCDIFMNELNVFVVPIRRSGYSFVSCIAEELRRTDKVAILSRVGGYAFGQAAEEARMIYPEQVYSYNYQDNADVERILKRLKASGFEAVICPSWVGSLVEKYGMRYTYILLPEKDILEAVRQAEFQLKIYNQQTLNETLISRILNLSTEGMAALDECGTVIDINDRACKILNARREDILNRHYKNTPLNAFDQSGDLSKGNEVRRSILTLQEQMILYDIQSIRIEEVLRANVISFNSAKHIKETEQCIRMKELKSDSVAAATFSSLIGGSPAMVQAIEKARRYAQVNSTVLITAPSGCGKELFAQSIHNASMRASGPFVVINCAALPESVLESLLFGYEPGTFTGGKKEGKAGLFELAHGGTVFLDEVSEMPLNIQARFLRVLQEREVVRLGGSRNIPIDIRVLAATNRDMWKLVQSGAFREDLYHRISTLLLEIPSLSERKEDIPALAQYFIYKRSRELQLAVHGIDAAALELLSQIHFTGNVRQLNNILERAMVLASSRLVTAEDIRNALPHSFPAETQSTMHSVFSPGTPATFAASPISPGTFVSNFHTLAQTSRQTEAELIRQVLTSTGGNRAKTAAMLGISTSTLWRKMKALEIQDY